MRSSVATSHEHVAEVAAPGHRFRKHHGCDSARLPLAVSESVVGFILLDVSLRVLYANADAVHILGYPFPATTPQEAYDGVARRIRAQIEDYMPSPDRPTLTELASGRRRYFCRAFAMNEADRKLSTGAAFRPSFAALIERRKSAIVELTQVGDQYELTPRERQALALLLQGLSSKEIAVRMDVSPNTVKAFLRSIMLRMRVSSRGAIVGKILAASVQPASL
jgi:DNA-binding CsgD family transcriptional regulator